MMLRCAEQRHPNAGNENDHSTRFDVLNLTGVYMLNRRIAPYLLTLCLLLAACRDDVLTTAPSAPQTAISDAASGGSPGFYFLPPLVPKPSYAGTFDALARPTVQVCNDAACASVHALFTMTSGTGSEVVRVDAANQLYIVNWHADKTGAIAGNTYRVRVLVDGVVAGFIDVLFRGKGVNASNVASNGAVVLVNGNTLPIKFRLETGRTGQQQPTQPSTCTSCLEVLPGAVLLTGSGSQKQLVAFKVDAQGNRTPVAATFTSSHPANVTVTGAGLLTAVANVGSSQIVAQAGPDVSAPVLAIVAQPVAGALLITDAQVEGGLTPVDPSAKQKPGWRYVVRLRGVTPLVGQVVLSAGYAPIQGKVISVTPAGSGLVDVVLELLPVNGLFVQLSINQHVSMGSPPAQALRRRSVFEPAPEKSLAQQPGQMPASNARIVRTLAGPRGADAAKVEFDLGPFECEAEITGGASFPLTFDLATFSLNPASSLDYVVENASLKRLVVHLSISPQIELSPRLTAAVEGSVECTGAATAPISPIILPITGVLAPLWGAFIEIGAGAGLEAKMPVGDLGFDGFAQATVTMDFGIDCSASCRTISDMSSNAGGSFKPVFPTDFSAGGEISASFFAYAALKFGSPTVDFLQYELVNLKAGLKQELNIKGMTAQALDASYASKFELAPFLEVEAGEDIQDVAEKLSSALELPSFSADLSPVAVSPSGTFTITPATAAPGNESSLGDSVTFTVTLNRSTYAGFDAIAGVEIRWLKTDGTGAQVLDFGRPGCTSLNATPNQTVFTCQTDFLEEDEGVQTFYAFVRAKLFGIEVPIPLEIGDDSKATVNVTKYGHVHRSIQYDNNGNTSETDLVTPDAAVGEAGGGFAGAGTVTYNATTNIVSNGCTFTVIQEATASSYNVVSTGVSNQWNLMANLAGTRTTTNQCTGTVGIPVPFTLNAILATGVSIFSNGTLIGINFEASGHFTGMSPGFLTSTGRLKVK